MNQHERFVVDVGGDFACFSRPEFKVERVTYPVMTPSAARGILEAIFWKPEVWWEVQRIDVLRPIRHFALLRNEVADRQSPRQERFVVEEKRQQRASLILRDVAYRIHANLMLENHATDPIPKYVEQVSRRLERGQYYHTPYLGTREFAAWFEPAVSESDPVNLDLDVGTMLFDIAFIPDEQRKEMSFVVHGADGGKEVEGYAQPIFFQAKVRSGVLEVPPELHDRKREMEMH